MEVNFMFHPRTRRKGGFTLVELLVVIAIIGILVALLLPAGLGLHNYENTYRCFPPAALGTPPPGGQALTPFILPYIELATIPYDFKYAWNHAENNAVIRSNGLANNQNIIPTLICPSAPIAVSRLGFNAAGLNGGPSDYCAFINIAATNPFLTAAPSSPYFNQTSPGASDVYPGFFGLNLFRRVGEIVDGTSNTLMLVECAGRTQHWEVGRRVNTTPPSTVNMTGTWANPRIGIISNGCDPSRPFPPTTGTVNGPAGVNCTNFSEIYAFHPGGANVVLGDGSVRLLNSQTPIYIVTALRTRSYGEVITLPD
jgi:prepilin-type N-terminal cleavage/methylation domain-containing protein/prepilin-type processing-associated H-X9-DG protein